MSKLKHGYASAKSEYRKTYEVWYGMMQRCHNKNNKDFEYYGARGIEVCKKWHDVKNFIKDMGKRPVTLTLERINNNKGYYKSNCMWATRAVQSQNRRCCHVINYKGRKISIAEAEKQTGIKSTTLRKRIKVLGANDKRLFMSEKKLRSVRNKENWEKRRQ